MSKVFEIAFALATIGALAFTGFCAFLFALATIAVQITCTVAIRLIPVALLVGLCYLIYLVATGQTCFSL